MARARTFQTAFVAGALDPKLNARTDVNQYRVGCERIENLLVLPQGPAERRPGTLAVDRLLDTGELRFAPFEFNETERYVFAFRPGSVAIYRNDGRFEQEVITPYGAGELQALRFVQFADIMIVVHPDYEQREIRRLANSWTISTFALQETTDGAPKSAYSSFADARLSVSGTTGSITLTTNKNYWINDNPNDAARTHIGKRIKVNGGVVRITGVTNARTATGTVVINLTNANTSSDWLEQSWSDLRGWPRSVALHAGRLWFGGSRELPGQLWASQVNFIRNFFPGSTAEDFPFELATDTGLISEIRALQSGPGGLEVFKSTEEGLIPSSNDNPITPTSAEYRRQTSYGSSLVRPVTVDNATVFVQRDGGSIREYRFTDVSESYDAATLTIRNPQIVNDPVALAAVSDGFDRKLDALFVVNRDGTVAVLTTSQTEELAAWSKWTTQGRVVDMVVAGITVWWAVDRGTGNLELEQFSPFAATDGATVQYGAGSRPTAANNYLIAEVPAATFTGDLVVDQPAGATVDVLFNGQFSGTQIVPANGAILVPDRISKFESGYPYRISLKSMPFAEAVGSGVGTRKRIYMVTTRAIDTYGLEVNGISLNMPPATAGQGVTGDYSVRLLGWYDDPRWTITQSGPHPATILGVATEVAFN